ncbi:hypothetical protein AALP_AA7G145400 [Arabis alpina]|uniref:Reverse transcriptase Ty1/copia-type domain-containing protein n=1 Tax=Arabis alpina TaxID=50452 RepID=A0A087GI19_ARAAL|nr:hypothetical protein AALP_AA7G145400 [Arabis alpina]
MATPLVSMSPSNAPPPLSLLPDEDWLIESSTSSSARGSSSVAAVTANVEPKRYYDAVKEDVWRCAMTHEVVALEENYTWDIVSLPPGKVVIGSKWVYKIKYNADGKIERHKARLVVLGNKQIEGEDFDETFAPVVKMSTVRGLLSLVSAKGWEVHQMDVHNAFLHGLLGCKPVSTPIEQNHQLASDESPLLKYPSSYRRLVGRLVYLRITHPELCYSIHLLSQFMKAPREGHWDAALRVVRFLKGSPGQDLPEDEIPDLMMLYLDEPDGAGHNYGPDDPRVTNAVSRVDKMIGRAIQGLKKREIFDEVHVILLGDHGMVTNCDKKTIYIDDLADWIKIPADWINAYSPVLAINPRWGKDVENPGEKNAEFVAKMNEALSSGKVENGEFLQVYLKEKLPERLHYSESSRIPPIVGMVGEGILVRQNRTNAHECYGDHRYDNQYFSMRSIFIGHGPRFRRGNKVPSFENVQIYNVVAEILGLQPASNNGSSLFTRNILSHFKKTGEVE